VILAYLVSEHIFKRIDGRQFLRIVYIVLFFAGLMTAYQVWKLL
jgi:hypothetical protein